MLFVVVVVLRFSSLYSFVGTVKKKRTQRIGIDMVYILFQEILCEIIIIRSIVLSLSLSLSLDVLKNRIDRCFDRFPFFLVVEPFDIYLVFFNFFNG
jgi:hypothetical protein